MLFFFSFSLEKFHDFHLHIIEIECGRFVIMWENLEHGMTLGVFDHWKEAKASVFHHYFNECRDKSKLRIH